MARPPLPRTVPLGRVVATRRLWLHGRPSTTVELRIGTPREVDQDAYCPVQLVGLGDEKVRPIFGVDTVQALQLAQHAARGRPAGPSAKRPRGKSRRRNSSASAR